MQRAARLKRELQMLATDPPHGVTCWLVEDSTCELEAQVVGQDGTPYHRGVFKLLLHLPERYPFEAPKVRFSTPIYHPNVDTGGRICLDILKPAPSGSWKPSMNISSVLTSILLLMAEPNPDDPLMVEISTEFKQNRLQFMQTAREWTRKFATDDVGSASSSAATSAVGTTASAGPNTASSKHPVNSIASKPKPEENTSHAHVAEAKAATSSDNSTRGDEFAPAPGHSINSNKSKSTSLLMKRRPQQQQQQQQQPTSQPSDSVEKNTSRGAAAQRTATDSSGALHDQESERIGSNSAVFSKPPSDLETSTATRTSTVTEVISSPLSQLSSSRTLSSSSARSNVRVAPSSRRACIIIDDDDSTDNDDTADTGSHVSDRTTDSVSNLPTAQKRPPSTDHDSDSDIMLAAKREFPSPHEEDSVEDIVYGSDEDIL